MPHLCSFYDIDQERDFYNLYSGDKDFYQLCSCKKHLWSKRAQRVLKIDEVTGSFLVSPAGGSGAPRYKAFVIENKAFEAFEAFPPKRSACAIFFMLFVVFLLLATASMAAFPDDVDRVLVAIREKMMQFRV
jgi:hypothetical protein